MSYDPFTNTRITMRVATEHLHWSYQPDKRPLRKVITIDTPLTGGEWNSCCLRSAMSFGAALPAPHSLMMFPTIPSFPMDNAAD
jgi:hypothetical protein